MKSLREELTEELAVLDQKAESLGARGMSIRQSIKGVLEDMTMPEGKRNAQMAIPGIKADLKLVDQLSALLEKADDLGARGAGIRNTIQNVLYHMWTPDDRANARIAMPLLREEVKNLGRQFGTGRHSETRVRSDHPASAQAMEMDMDDNVA